MMLKYMRIEVAVRRYFSHLCFSFRPKKAIIVRRKIDEMSTKSTALIPIPEKKLSIINLQIHPVSFLMD